MQSLLKFWEVQGAQPTATGMPLYRLQTKESGVLDAQHGQRDQHWPLTSAMPDATTLVGRWRSGNGQLTWCWQLSTPRATVLLG